MVYIYSNRRRVKDAITAIRERHGTEGMSVMVKDGLVYLQVDKSYPDLSGITHFSEPGLAGTIKEMFDFTHVTEYYSDYGVEKFRV